MRSALALAAGALAGCQLVFPLTPGEPLPPDAKITGTFVERVVRHTAAGPVLEEGPATQDVAIRARFVVDEEVRSFEVPLAANGSFEIDRLAVEYSLEITFPTSSSDQVPLELFEDRETLKLAIARGGEAPAAPVTRATEIRLPTASPERSVVTLGQYSNTTANGQTMFDWRDAAPTGGFELGLLSAADQLFVLDYEAGRFQAGQTAIAAVGSMAVAMLDGDPVDLQMLQMTATVLPDGCLDLDLPLTPAIDRFAGIALATHPGFDTPAAGWTVVSVPKIETGFTGAVRLATGLHPANETDFRVEYADPFAGHALYLAAFAQAVRVVPGTSIQIGSSFTEATPVPRGDCAVGGLSPIDGAYAADLRLDGQPLVEDDTTVTVSRTAPAIVTWTSEGLVDFFDVSLFEVVDEVLVRRRVFRTRTPRVEIENALLSSGTAYVLVVTANHGTPGAEDGDYSAVQYPIMTTSIPSALFRPD